MCLGGAIAGGLLAAVFVFQGSLVGSDTLTPLQRVPSALSLGIIGATIGAALGLIGGLVLARPLAAVLGRFGGEADAGEPGTVRPSDVA